MEICVYTMELICDRGVGVLHNNMGFSVTVDILHVLEMVESSRLAGMHNMVYKQQH